MTTRTWTVRAEDGGPQACSHTEGVDVLGGPAQACEDCLREGTPWVHLRRCLACDHVGCCDNSPRRHATGHFRGTGHPLVSSAERGEHWGWCYADEVLLVPAPRG